MEEFRGHPTFTESLFSKFVNAKTVTVRHRLPWYTDEIKEQKRRIHRRE